MTTLSIAHRGFYAKDNTKDAFTNAVEAGFHMLEADIHKTKDNQLVLCHDLFIGRYCVEETTLHTLQSYSPNLLTLKAFFEAFPPTTHLIYLDLKGSDSIVQLLIHFMIDHSVCCDNIIVASFNRYHIQGLSYSFLSWKVAFITCNTFRQFEYDALIQDVDIVVMSWTALSHDIISYLHQCNKQVYTYTCTDQNVYRYMQRFHLDGIVSDILLE